MFHFKCFLMYPFIFNLFCVSFVLLVRVLVLKVFVKRELYFFLSNKRITTSCVLWFDFH